MATETAENNITKLSFTTLQCINERKIFQWSVLTVSQLFMQMIMHL